jgi:hypothetical protein
MRQSLSHRVGGLEFPDPLSGKPDGRSRDVSWLCSRSKPAVGPCCNPVVVSSLILVKSSGRVCMILLANEVAHGL